MAASRGALLTLNNRSANLFAGPTTINGAALNVTMLNLVADDHPGTSGADIIVDECGNMDFL